MKNLKSYRYFCINEDLKIFTKQDNEDSYTITLRDNDEFAGSCYLDIKTNAYWYFEDDMSEEEYDKLFPNDIFLHIENLAIKEKYRNKGYAKKLLELIIDKAKELGIKQIYLNASHISMNQDLPRLIKLYESFGFNVFLHQGNNALMIKNLE
jgi:ribosomal protein S18 acetylase RimI-like enzyme